MQKKHRECDSILNLDQLLTLRKNKDGDLEFLLASSDYSIKPSKETLGSIERDLSAQIKKDKYPHDSTIWCENILKEIRKAREKK